MSIKTIFAGLAMAAAIGFAPQVEARTVPQATGYEDTAVEDVLAKAESGDMQAQLEMGRRFYYREDMKSDAMALKWFEAAAAQGDANAQYEAATMYILGEGTRADSQKAIYWYKKAGAGGFIEAWYDIGLIYHNGEGVPVDYVEAAKWLTLAANEGEKRAQYYLGMMYRDGRGVTQDPAEAVRLLKASVRQKHTGAAEALEEMYGQGIGVPKDPILSHAWHTMAYHLRNIDGVKPTEGGKALFFIVPSPDLSPEDNLKAWDIYTGLAKELGFAGPDTVGKDGRTVRDGAVEFFAKLPKNP